MNMESIKFVESKTIDQGLDLGWRLIVAGNVHVKATPGEFWSILNCDWCLRCVVSAFRRLVKKLCQSSQGMHSTLSSGSSDFDCAARQFQGIGLINGIRRVAFARNLSDGDTGDCCSTACCWLKICAFWVEFPWSIR